MTSMKPAKFFLPAILLLAAITKSVAAITPLPDVVPCAVADRQDFQVPDRVQLAGWIGMRVASNEANRLVKIDTDRLLEGYRHRPGRQSWDGEHVGKWLHAATLAWVNTGDPALREKLDHTVAELSKCQMDDGYLGTYVATNRWKSWDVWAHKYNLIGLLTYVRYTGNQAPMTTCRRMGDLLCNTFGDEPGKRDIIPCGEHVGMAPTSVLEPMVLLYRMTGEQRYLDFCKYIIRAWEQPNGPHIISALLTAKRVDKVGNAKAYEMLSCLNGALEYYRTVGGDRQILDACLNAWQDIVDKRLYLTGAASAREHFHDDFELPNVDNVGETCVTVTWLQLNAQLLRLTGEARFAEQLDRVILNQLFGAQRPDCAAWGYYVQMEGKKPYSSTLDGHCCLSSGPRGVALIPTFAVSADADGIAVNLYDAGAAQLVLRDGTQVGLITDTKFPADGRIRMSLEVPPQGRWSRALKTIFGIRPRKEFTMKLRLPAWCRESAVKINDTLTPVAPGSDGYAALHRKWRSGDVLELNLKLEPRVISGDHLNAGKFAILYGPLVLAADEALLTNEVKSLGAVVVANPDLAALNVTPEPAPENVRTWPGAQVFHITIADRKTGSPVNIRLLPFADAGGTGTRYKIWLPARREPGASVLSDGEESRSRQGNRSGSILDDDPQSIVVSFDGNPANEDWFAVTLAEPAAIRRVVFAHGKNYHDGGWFDTSAARPKIQIQRAKNGAWETIGELTDYPATTAADGSKLKDGQAITLRLATPVTAAAVRVIGVPASGDDPKQAFASCAELQAFGE